MPRKSRASHSADPQASQSTRDRIIDAAEMLFAQQGYEGTTTRAIAMRADVPLGLMSYYFGTKSDLYSEVVMRRSAEHAADIAASVKAVADRGDEASIADIVTAFIMPPIRRALTGGKGWAAYVKLLSLAANTPGSEPHIKTFAREYAKVVEDFIAMLRAKMPGASEEDVYWGFYILNSAFIHVLVENQTIDRLSGGRCKASDLETVAAKMAVMFEAGIARLAKG